MKYIKHLKQNQINLNKTYRIRYQLVSINTTTKINCLFAYIEGTIYNEEN